MEETMEEGEISRREKGGRSERGGRGERASESRRTYFDVKANLGVCGGEASEDVLGAIEDKVDCVGSGGSER
jgi:hypothetical protein|tara:strand:+ start:383 stop:598 length:216 start_codon:yes stop_codon:yes gene_type:complete